MLHKMLVAVMATIAVLMQAVATTHEVGTVADLKSAVKDAAAGDTIVITTSLTPSSSDFTPEDDGTKSFLTVTKDNLTIMGSNESSRKTWEQGAEPVIIDCGSIGRFLQNNGSNLTVKNITVTGCKIAITGTQYGAIANGNSTVFTNCVFRQNNDSGRTAFWSYNNFTLRDCAYNSNTANLTGYAYNCDIAGNTAVTKFINRLEGCNVTGNVVNDSFIRLSGNAVVTGCSFKGNKALPLIAAHTAGNAFTVQDCVFEANTNTIIYTAMSDSSGVVSVSDCTFTSNVIASANSGTYGYLILNSTDSFASYSAAQSHFTVARSTFTGTLAASVNNIAEVYGVYASRCNFGSQATIRESIAYNNLNSSACSSCLEDCDICGGDIKNSVLNRCKIHDVTRGMYACFRDYCRVTNSLVANFSPENTGNTPKLYCGIDAHDAEFVNCTFASNKADTYRRHDRTMTVNDIKFVNCIFYSNKKADGTETDFSMQNDEPTLGSWNSNVSFDHCFYGKFTATVGLNLPTFSAKTGENLLELCANPKFVQDSRPEAPYWSLSLRSPLIGKGDASIWTAEDVDLAGKLRLKDGLVDPGCYQCWLNPAGLIMIFR